MAARDWARGFRSSDESQHGRSRTCRTWSRQRGQQGTGLATPTTGTSSGSSCGCVCWLWSYTRNYSSLFHTVNYFCSTHMCRVTYIDRETRTATGDEARARLRAAPPPTRGTGHARCRALALPGQGFGLDRSISPRRSGRRSSPSLKERTRAVHFNYHVYYLKFWYLFTLFLTLVRYGNRD